MSKYLKTWCVIKFTEDKSERKHYKLTIWYGLENKTHSLSKQCHIQTAWETAGPKGGAGHDTVNERGQYWLLQCLLKGCLYMLELTKLCTQSRWPAAQSQAVTPTSTNETSPWRPQKPREEGWAESCLVPGTFLMWVLSYSNWTSPYFRTKESLWKTFNISFWHQQILTDLIPTQKYFISYVNSSVLF